MGRWGWYLLDCDAAENQLDDMVQILKKDYKITYNLEEDLNNSLSISYKSHAYFEMVKNQLTDNLIREWINEEKLTIKKGIITAWLFEIGYYPKTLEFRKELAEYFIVGLKTLQGSYLAELKWIPLTKGPSPQEYLNIFEAYLYKDTWWVKVVELKRKMDRALLEELNTEKVKLKQMLSEMIISNPNSALVSSNKELREKAKEILKDCEYFTNKE